LSSEPLGDPPATWYLPTDPEREERSSYPFKFTATLVFQVSWASRSALASR
jgi:hypothetical protein